MSTMVKMYIHVLLVDMTRFYLENVSRISLINNKMFKCVAYFRHNQTSYTYV